MSDNGPLAGKRVIVIGGGGAGNGGAISRYVAASGASHLAIVDVDGARAQEAATAAGETFGAETMALQADVRSAAQVATSISTAVSGFGGLDVLITVVGGAGTFVPWQHLNETSDEQWDLLFEVNLRYVFHALRAVIPVFLEGGGGTIVSLGSLAGTPGIPKSGAYGAAKAGLANLAATVSAEYGRQGIRMNVVNCGMIMGPAALVSLPDDVRDQMAAAIPAGRLGTPDDVARAVVFVASDGSSYLSGQAINVDGGATARSPLPGP